MFELPKPKKGEIYATFNNDFAFEKGLEKLEKIQDIRLEVLDSHTIRILLKKRNPELVEAVKFTIRSSKGYVEHDLENINALNSQKTKKGEYGVLDTPFYG
jgi:hypothetical protein